MKEFFAEYGSVVIAALVVIALIAIVSLLRPTITNACNDVIMKLKNYVDTKLGNSLANSGE